MRHDAVGTVLVAGLLIACASCSREATSPTFGPRTLVSVRVIGDTLPARIYCTPSEPNSLQWVDLSRLTLVVNQFDNFELTANQGTGWAKYTIREDGTRIFDNQWGHGGSVGVWGYIQPRRDGVRELVVSGQTSFADSGDLAGHLSGDSAIITNRIRCPVPAGRDSAHVFTVVLK